MREEQENAARIPVGIFHPFCERQSVFVNVTKEANVLSVPSVPRGMASRVHPSFTGSTRKAGTIIGAGVSNQVPIVCQGRYENGEAAA